MRAMVLAATGDAETDRLEAREIPEPTPGAGEIAIAVEACGVCRTDLHIVEGEVSAEIPLVPGHQVAGRVSKVGSGAAGLREETRSASDGSGGRAGSAGSARRNARTCVSRRSTPDAIAPADMRNR